MASNGHFIELESSALLNDQNRLNEYTASYLNTLSQSYCKDGELLW